MTAQRSHRPAVTQVRVAPTRLPADARTRLIRLAVRGGDAFHRHARTLQPTEPDRAARAKLCHELCMGLELALGDLAGAEQRATAAEQRQRRAEEELATARQTIITLQAELADRVHAEFAEPTAVRPEQTNPLAARCLTRQGVR